MSPHASLASMPGARSDARPPERSRAAAAARPPRLGFLGVGWIGRNRLEAIAAAGVAEIARIADPQRDAAEACLECAPDAELAASLDALLDAELDGIVIATPSALHAEQSVRALEAGLSVFCQKPLGRTAAEAQRVVDAARAADRLLGVDFSYRHTAALQRIRERIRGGALGDVFAADLVFHNAYGPDKDWFYDRARAGGGCVMDLGVHLVDLALWIMDFPEVEHVSSRLYSGGRAVDAQHDGVEDYAVATLGLAGGRTVRLACSWRLHAGRDAVIEAAFHGTRGGAALRNVDGSFYDFVGELYRGTATERLAEPPDAWGGRAAVEWARRLAAGERFDPSARQFVHVARTLDRIYGR